jgi:3'-phosphoadenosine 5'-phosphosulfate sulfotransferase (PAPS reductase)/FAD synthetase
MVSRWEARFTEGKRRYENLEVFNLIGPWSSASLRFCTAELKQQVISPALAREFPGRTIISVLGIRREESVGRRNRPISQDESRWDKRDGTRLMSWCPGVGWSTKSVFARHRMFQLPLHEAYTEYGCSRVSCAFCVLQSLPDQLASVKAPGNRGLLLDLVDLEARSTYSFQQGRWLADLAPHLLPNSLCDAIGRAKRMAEYRSELEGALPAGLRYVKGWPPRLPTWEEAEQIVRARSVILSQHELQVMYGTPQAVINRFQQLKDAQAAKLAR